MTTKGGLDIKAIKAVNKKNTYCIYIHVLNILPVQDGRIAEDLELVEVGLSHERWGWQRLTRSVAPLRIRAGGPPVAANFTLGTRNVNASLWMDNSTMTIVKLCT